jgi:hypothetical protein
MLLHHPQIASLSCDECKKWLYDLKTGKRRERGGVPQPRPPGAATPCHECPKGSPEREQEHVLTDRNWQTLTLYLRNRALLGLVLSPRERSDALLQRNFAIIDTQIRKQELHEPAEAMSLSVMSQLASHLVPSKHGRRT